MSCMAIAQGRCGPRDWSPSASILPFSFTTHRSQTSAVRRPRSPLHCWRSQQRHAHQSAALVASSEGGKAVAFPAGKKQAKVRLPACFIQLDPSALQQEGLQEQLAAAISAGATGVLLTSSAGTGDAQLYGAACQLKEMLRGRAVLLVADRTDIVDASEADGVALSSKGMPIMVATRLMKGGSSLVAAIASSAAQARNAARDGANLVFLVGEDGDSIAPEEAAAAKSLQSSSGSIPVILSVPAGGVGNKIRADVDGVVLDFGGMGREAATQVEAALTALSGSTSAQIATQASSTASMKIPKETAESSPAHLLDASKEALLEAERAFLSEALAFLQEAAPEMEEIGLLSDALKQLDELFLLVVVGEFNSGKSSVINALLGDRYLAEGILPTTNEISVLKFSESGDAEAVQNEDGFFVRKLPAQLLQDVNIVDTPGTNVIVDRQQRLTEEYVPRADLVLFCLSADRPFTDSEVRFLKYIRQWGKKVIFLVNKVDILSNEGEIEEVVQFVANNASRLLGVDTAQVFPLAARTALDAKMHVGGGRGLWGLLRREDQDSLQRDPRWGASRFGRLEHFIFETLVGGGGGAGGESVRLKLQTPLFVADALLAAGAERLADDLQAAQQELEAVRSVQGQLAAFRAGMERDSGVQRTECRKLVSRAVKRGEQLVESTLQLSNLEALSSYLFGSGKDARGLPIARSFQAEVVGNSASELASLIAEHATWLESNCEQQLAYYRRFAEEQSANLGSSSETLPEPSSSAPASNGSGDLSGKSSASGGINDDVSAEERRRWRERSLAATDAGENGTAAAQGAVVATSGSPQEGGRAVALSQPAESDSSTDTGTALAVVGNFEPAAAAVLLEEEIREAVIGTTGAAVGAAGLGIVLTTILPTTLEDILAVAVAGLIGYAAVLNLPLRRAEAKEKLRRVATTFSAEVEAKLEAELDAGVQSCIEAIKEFILPLQSRMEAEVARIQDLQARQAGVAERLEALQQRAANIE